MAAPTSIVDRCWAALREDGSGRLVLDAAAREALTEDVARLPSSDHVVTIAHALLALAELLDERDAAEAARGIRLIAAVTAPAIEALAATKPARSGPAPTDEPPPSLSAIARARRRRGS